MKKLLLEHLDFGVSLGISPEQIDTSVNTIKNVEETRAITFLNNSLSKLDENDSHSLVIRNASNLCDDLDNEENEPQQDHMGLIIERTIGKRQRTKKKGTGLEIKRRSTRIEKLRSKQR